MSNLIINPDAPAVPVVIHAAAGPEEQTRQKVEGVVIPFPPAPTTLSELPKSMQEMAPLENNRDSGNKYFESIQGYKYVLADYQLVNKTDCFTAVKAQHVRSTNENEKYFLACLGNALKVINGSDPKMTFRDRYKETTRLLRLAAQTEFYQQNKTENDPFCRLLQDLCEAKFNGVYPHDSFTDLVTKAARSAGTEGNEAIALLRGNYVNKHTVGGLTRNVNTALHNASSEYKKGKLAKWGMKLSGKMGIDFDPTGGPNVPYVRSRFTLQAQGAEKREVDFLRMGTPTIQMEEGTPATIDPMFLVMLDGMQRRGENFLYVNHQRVKHSTQERNRAFTIQGIEFRPGYENFHFMSVPLDGPITDAIKHGIAIQDFKKMVVESFVKGENGCRLPKPRFGVKEANPEAFDATALERLVSHVHSSWFADKPVLNRNELEAFWGITQTVLKHAVILQLEIDRMCSTCKDCVDRGGTLATIDEAVRQVLRGEHENREELRQLGFNALHPYVVKLEPILDGDKKHNRLGFFVHTADHIAKLSSEQVERIQRDHATLYCRVTGQELAPKRPQEPPEKWVELGSMQQQPDVIVKRRPDEEIKWDVVPKFIKSTDAKRLTTTEPVDVESEADEQEPAELAASSLPLFELTPHKEEAEPSLEAFACKKAESGVGNWVIAYKNPKEDVGNRVWQLSSGVQEPLEPFVDPKLLPVRKIEGNDMLEEVKPGQWKVIARQVELGEWQPVC